MYSALLAAKDQFHSASSPTMYLRIAPRSRLPNWNALSCDIRPPWFFVAVFFRKEDKLRNRTMLTTSGDATSGAVVPAGAGATETFGKLKKDLLFHEKRMQLLLSTRTVEDLGHALKEKSLTRAECARDCRDGLARFEQGASDARLTGRWDELKVHNLFKLEVPLRFVVGSSKFEAPETTDAQSMKGMVERLHALSTRYPEFAVGNDDDSVQALLSLLQKVEFTSRDMARMKGAVVSKLEVLSELDDLTQVLQNSGFEAARVRAQLEELRRGEERAKEGGEVALSEEAITSRMGYLERLIDIIFFQAHTINSTIDTNVAKRNSNVSAFQSASAMLECMKSEKRELAIGCDRDCARILRGMEFEDKAKDSGRGKVLEQMRQSRQHLASLDSKQEALTLRLQQLYEEFAETEDALAKLGAERAKAVQAHIDLAECSRHATSDFLELVQFSSVYRKNLEHTKAEYEQGIEALAVLERVLLQEKSFDQYDFHASGQRLASMRKKVCKELNGALNEYEAAVKERVRRKTFQLQRVADELEVATGEMELRKEVLDPLAKRHVQRVRELEAKRDALERDRAALLEALAKQRDARVAEIRQHLDEGEVTDVSDAEAAKDISRREELADRRAAILHSRERAADDVTDESLRLLRERQAAAGAALSASSGASAAASRGGGSRGSADKRPGSRALAVRGEIEKARQAPYTPTEGSRAVGALADSASDVATAAAAETTASRSGDGAGGDADGAAKAAPRRIRTIQPAVPVVRRDDDDGA